MKKIVRDDWLDMQVFERRRLSHGAVIEDACDRVFPKHEAAYRKLFARRYL